MLTLCWPLVCEPQCTATTIDPQTALCWETAQPSIFLIPLHCGELAALITAADSNNLCIVCTSYSTVQCLTDSTGCPRYPRMCHLYAASADGLVDHKC